MKKLLFLLLFIPTLSFAGITDSIGTKISNAVTSVDTSSTTKMVYNDVKTAIKTIASGLKTTAEHLMEVVAKKYFIQGVIDLITSGICVLLIIFLYKVISKSLKGWNEAEKNNTEIFNVFGVMLPSLGIIFLSFVAYDNMQEGLLYTLNPEYYVIEDIFNFIKDNYKR